MLSKKILTGYVEHTRTQCNSSMDTRKLPDSWVGSGTALSPQSCILISFVWEHEADISGAAMYVRKIPVQGLALLRRRWILDRKPFASAAPLFELT